MWLPDKAFELFTVSKENIDSLKEDLAAVRADRDATKIHLVTVQANFEWLRVRVNALEIERVQLIEKAYGLKIPAPEIARAPVQPLNLNQDIFNDMGEDMAKTLGYPVYNS